MMEKASKIFKLIIQILITFILLYFIVEYMLFGDGIPIDVN